MKQENRPLVTVICLSYNHEKFIKECLDGFVMQQTNFPFEIIVHDDASIDNSQQIVREYESKYPHLFFNIYQTENQFSKKEVNIWYDIMFPKAKGKYIAMCDGDDYWTDPYKLQKQVDFLEANSEYSICWTKYFEKNETDKLSSLQEPDWISQINLNDNLTIDLNTIFTPYCTYTLTCLFRRDVADFALFEKLRYSKDNSLYALCLSKGVGMLMNFYSAVYRKHQGGIYSLASEFVQKYTSYLNLKEIVYKIPYCNNLNIRTIRNCLLEESIKLYPKYLSFHYLNLIYDGFKFLGFKKSVRLVIGNLRKCKIWKIITWFRSLCRLIIQKTILKQV